MVQLLLFDVDGTLAESTLIVSENMLNVLTTLNENSNYELGIVGGGDYEKIVSQIGKDNIHLFKYVFSENGIVSYKNQLLIHKNDIKNELSEEYIQKIINFVLRYIADLELPFKRGSFVKFRTGMLYVTPIGGDCSREERKTFIEYDKIHNVRQTMINIIKQLFPDIECLLGGAIGIGIHPKGWNKSYIVQFLQSETYDKIRFYGDRCEENGNDYPLYSHPNIDGNFVADPNDTLNRLYKLVKNDQ